MLHSEEDLQNKIDSFLQRKNAQFPELVESFKSTEADIDGSSHHSHAGLAYSW